MSLTLPQSLSYPLYMGAPRLRMPMLWPSAPFRMTPASTGLAQFPSTFPMSQPMIPPYTLPLQKNTQPKIRKSSSPYSNRRYQNLKQSTAHPQRRSRYSSLDPSIEYHQNYANNEINYTNNYKPLKTKSVSDFEYMSQHSAIPIPKSHSWHTMMAHRRSNLSAAYASEMQLSPRHRRKNSLRKKRKNHSSKTLHSSPRSISSSSKTLPPPLRRTPSTVRRKKMAKPISEFGSIRISTLDELPISTTQANSSNNNANSDRVSMKGSISNSTKRQKISKDANSLKTRKTHSHRKENRADLDTESLSSTASSNTSYSSLQQRLNGSLRNDPLITAAMQDFQEHVRSSSTQNLSSSLRDRTLSNDSLSSDSTIRSSRRSRNNSQSSFTSVERSEIRKLIKTVKTKGVKTLNVPLPLAPVPIPVPPPEQLVTKSTESSARASRPRKSSLTEELDREFNRLRALDPDQELTYVTPSAVCKRKRSAERTKPKSPPPPTFNELLRQVQLRPVEKATKPLPSLKEKKVESAYENPLSSIAVPRSSPILVPEEKIEITTKHEYAVPIKKSEEKPIPQISHFQPVRKSTFNKPITPSLPATPALHRPTSHTSPYAPQSYQPPVYFPPMHTQPSHPPSVHAPPTYAQPAHALPTHPPPTYAPPAHPSPAVPEPSHPTTSFQWPQYGLTNPILTTFQPHASLSHQSEHSVASAKENIYTDDIDVCIPSSTIEKDDNDALQNHLDNQTIVTDDLYTDFGTKQTVITSSILDDFSLLFKRKHKQQNQFTKRNQRCSIM